MDRNNGKGTDMDAVKPRDAEAHDSTHATDGGDEEEARPMYGVFSPDPYDTVARSIAAGTFVGGTWAAGGLAVACIAAICSGSDFVTARWALSVIIAFVACGMLQQVAFNCQKTDGWTYIKSVLTFGIAFYVVLALCVLIGAWFPAGLWQAWLLFTAVYAVILVAASLAGAYGDDAEGGRE